MILSSVVCKQTSELVLCDSYVEMLHRDYLRFGNSILPCVFQISLMRALEEYTYSRAFLEY